MRRRRGATVVGVTLVAALGVLLWGIPNVAGPALIDVRLVALPIGDGVAANRSITLDDGEPVSAAGLQLAIRVTGLYPLPVAVGGSVTPLRVELRSLAGDGTTKLVWAIDGSAAALEEGDDSPDDGIASRAYLVAPGSIKLTIGRPEGVPLVDVDGGRLAAGRYDLRAFAFGVASGTLVLVLRD